MKNSTSLFKQDPLALALMEAREKKWLELEKQKSELEQKRQTKLEHIRGIAKRTVELFLVNKLGIASYRIQDIVENKNTKLQVYKMTLKSLLLSMALRYFVKLNLLGLSAISLWSFIRSLMLVSDTTYTLGYLGFKFFAGTMGFLVCFFIYIRIKSCFLRWTSFHNEPLTFYEFRKTVGVLRQDISDMEKPDQKLIGQS
ncbi:MAG: hypothetical protein HYT61_02225 [Candidatus Yanofskybacteria bacterium]|nr:hypothetical protein [Candidatus Yanofskybacteria bacterium]